jgi:hypothetical protein
MVMWMEAGRRSRLVGARALPSGLLFGSGTAGGGDAGGGYGVVPVVVDG